MDFADYQDARFFFLDKPAALCTTLAVRAALRVFPAIWLGTFRSTVTHFKEEWLEPAVRQLGAAHGAVRTPALRQTLEANVDPFEYIWRTDKTPDGFAAGAADNAIAIAATSAGRVMEGEGRLVPIFATCAVNRAALSLQRLAATPAIALGLYRKAIWQDIGQFQIGATASAVCGLPLWPDTMPDELRLVWREMKDAYTEGGDVPVWIGWFEDRLQGRTPRARDEKLAALWVDAVVRSQQDAARK
jgi:hypothetical protein